MTETDGHPMRVKFSYWGLETENASSDKAVEVPEDATLDDLLGRLSLSLERDLRREAARDGTRFVTINGRYCAVPEDLSRRLEDGDEVRVLPFVAGG